MPELTLKLGNSVIERYVFDKDVVSIGRSRDNDIVVENLSVSRNHSRIKRQEGKFVLTDLNSANGTYVNGVRISKTEIVDGDVITLGKHTIEFRNVPVSDDELIVEALGADRTIVVDRAPIGYLVVTDGRLKGKEFALTKLETSIGKGPNNDIVLSDDWFLSKKQAVVTLRSGSYELQDLGGFRKTRLNGGVMSAPAVLRAGNVVEFGNTRCTFELRTPPAPGPTAGGRMPREIAADDSIFSGVVSYREHEPVDELQDSRPSMEPVDEAVHQPVPVIGEEDLAIQPGVQADSGLGDQPTGDESATPQPAPETADSEITGGSAPGPGRQKGRKRRKAQGTGGDFHTVEFSSRAEDAEEDDRRVAPVRENQPAQAEVAGPMGPAVPATIGSRAGAGDDPEILIWEKALNNKSPIIRKQAAQRLKALTGKDYAT